MPAWLSCWWALALLHSNDFRDESNRDDQTWSNQHEHDHLKQRVAQQDGEKSDFLALFFWKNKGSFTRNATLTSRQIKIQYFVTARLHLAMDLLVKNLFPLPPNNNQADIRSKSWNTCGFLAQRNNRFIYCRSAAGLAFSWASFLQLYSPGRPVPPTRYREVERFRESE